MMHQEKYDFDITQSSLLHEIIRRVLREVEFNTKFTGSLSISMTTDKYYNKK